MKIILAYQQKDRDLMYYKYIKDEILKLNKSSTVKIINAGNKLDILLQSIKMRPDVIFTIPFKSKFTSVPIYIIKFFFNTKIITFTTEGFFNFKSNKNFVFGVGDGIHDDNLIDNYIFWGKKTGQVIGNQLLKNKKIKNLDLIKIAGYPRLEYYNKDKGFKSEFIKKNNLQHFDYVFLFVSGYQMANQNRSLLKQSKAIKKDQFSFYLNLIEDVKKNRKQFVQTLNDLANDNKNIFFIHKIHPNENLNDYVNSSKKNLKIFSDEKYNIMDLIKVSDFFFHYGSSTVIDSIICKKPSIYFYTDKTKHHFSDIDSISDFSINLNKLSDFVRSKKFLSINEKNNNEKSKTFSKNFFNFSNDQEYLPSREIAKIIIAKKANYKIKIYNPYLIFSFLVIIYLIILNLFKRSSKVLFRT
jgi:surface carbohydrate biosynthesis protein